MLVPSVALTNKKENICGQPGSPAHIQRGRHFGELLPHGQASFAVQGHRQQIHRGTREPVRCQIAEPDQPCRQPDGRWRLAARKKQAHARTGRRHASRAPGPRADPQRARAHLGALRHGTDRIAGIDQRLSWPLSGGQHQSRAHKPHGRSCGGRRRHRASLRRVSQ
ncbi:hypothetical protein D9M69_573320 [compost metagenome]